MKINSNWQEVVKTINGIMEVDGLNTGEGLGMKYGGSTRGPEEWAGTAHWYAGNCRIVVNSWEEKMSLLELRTDSAPADDVALKTWEKLARLLEQAESPTTSVDVMRTKYDELAILWVNRPEFPKRTVEEFLQMHENKAPVTKRTFYRRVLPNAYKKGYIGKKGKYYTRKE